MDSKYQRESALFQINMLMSRFGYSEHIKRLAQTTIATWGRCDELAFLANGNPELPNEVFQTYQELFYNGN